jgi:hypothetical protein
MYPLGKQSTTRSVYMSVSLTLTSLEKMYPHLPVRYTSKPEDFNTVKFETYLQHVTDTRGKETVEEKFGRVILLDPRQEEKYKPTKHSPFKFPWLKIIAINALGYLALLGIVLLLKKHLPYHLLQIK